MAEGAPLLRVYRETYRGFESLPLRQFPHSAAASGGCKAFLAQRAATGRAPEKVEINPERWPSGLRRTLGKRVYRKVPWVRIPLSPPPSLLLQRLGAHTREQSEKFARFRGVLAGGLSRIRTGDGGFGASKAQQPAFSLLASWAVRIRSRFASEY